MQQSNKFTPLMQPNQKKLLWDVLENCRAIVRYQQGSEFAEFQNDDKTQAAIERRLEIIGEGLRRLREIDEVLLSEKVPEYFKIIGLRNHIAHGYDSVELETLWDVSKNHIPPLIEKVEAWMNDI